MNFTDLVSLPTDNLYKFMAMSGLLVAGASVGLAAHHYRQVQRRLFEVKRRLTVFKAKSKATGADTELLDKVISELKRQILESLEAAKLAQAYGTRGASVPDYSRILDSIEKMVDVNARSVAQHGIEIAEIEADTDELEVLSDQLRTLNRISQLGVAVGASLVGVGLFFWYTRVQLLLDQALAIQSALPK